MIILLYYSSTGRDAKMSAEIKSLKKAKLDAHAGEEETSMMYYINPAFVDQEALKSETGLDQDRLSNYHMLLQA